MFRDNDVQSRREPSGVAAGSIRHESDVGVNVWQVLGSMTDGSVVERGFVSSFRLLLTFPSALGQLRCTQDKAVTADSSR